MQYNLVVQVMWPAIILACATCSNVSAKAVAPHVRASAPLVVRGLMSSTVDLTMQITGLAPAALNIRTALIAKIPRSPAYGTLHRKGKPASCLSQLNVTHGRASCAGSAAVSDCLWKRFTLMPITLRISTNRRPPVANTRECGDALLPVTSATLFAADFSVDKSAFATLRLLRSIASPRYRGGGLAMMAASRIARRLQPRAVQPQQRACQHKGSPAKHLEELATTSNRSELLTAAAECRLERHPESCARDQHPPLKAACSTVLGALRSCERVPAAIAEGDSSSTVPPASADDSGGTRLTAISSRHDYEDQSTACRSSDLSFIQDAKDYELSAAAEAAPNAYGRMQRVGRRPCNPFLSSFQRWPMSSCAHLGSDVGRGSLNNFRHDAASSSTHRRSSDIHTATSTAGIARPSWGSCYVACSSSRAAVGAHLVPCSRACSTFVSAVRHATTTTDAVPYFHSGVLIAQRSTSAATPTQTERRDFSRFHARTWENCWGNAAAGNVREYVMATAATGWTKPLQIPLVVSTKEQQRTAVRCFLPLCISTGRMSLGASLSQQHPKNQWLNGWWKKGHVSAALFSRERRHVAVLSVNEQQRCNKIIPYSSRVLSSFLSKVEIPLHNKSLANYIPFFTKRFLFSIRNSGNGSATAVCATATASSYSLTQFVAYAPNGGALSAALPASRVTATTALRSRTGNVASATGASGQTWLHGNGELTKPHRITMASIPLAVMPTESTWVLELYSSRRRHYAVTTAHELQLCGSLSDGAARADMAISARAGSSCGSVVSASKATQQQLTNPKTFLSFDACTVRLPHPSKRDKGGEDASACSSRLLVVADGVGGWGMSGVDAGLYSRELVQRLKDIFDECCGEKHVQQEQQQGRGKGDSTASEGAEAASAKKSPAENTKGSVMYERTPDPVQLLKAAYLTTRAIGSSTCCLVVLDRLQRRVRCANIGDSGFILYRPSKDKIIARSNFQSHDFNFPLQLGTGSSDMPEHAHVLELPVQEGDIFLLATDGLWDNLYDEQVLDVFRRGLDVRAAAGELSRLAFKCSQDTSWNSPFSKKEKEVMGLPGRHAGGKPDDITVVVALVKEVDSETGEPCS